MLKPNSRWWFNKVGISSSPKHTTATLACLKAEWSKTSQSFWRQSCVYELWDILLSLCMSVLGGAFWNLGGTTVTTASTRTIDTCCTVVNVGLIVFWSAPPPYIPLSNVSPPCKVFERVTLPEPWSFFCLQDSSKGTWRKQEFTFMLRKTCSSQFPTCFIWR